MIKPGIMIQALKTYDDMATYPCYATCLLVSQKVFTLSPVVWPGFQVSHLIFKVSGFLASRNYTQETFVDLCILNM